MRVRFIVVVAGVLVIGALVGILRAPGEARARLQEGTPTAEASGTPTVQRVVTLVGWYQPDASGDFLNIGPLTTNQFLVAGPAPESDRQVTGKANFNDPGNNDLPRITLGDSVFDAYPLNPDDASTVFRWLYFNDEQGTRPATLVMQIKCTSSPAYKDYTGTATFVSRAADSGGVLVIVINPPA